MDDTETSAFTFMAAVVVHEAGFTGIDNLTETAGTTGPPETPEAPENTAAEALVSPCSDQRKWCP